MRRPAPNRRRQRGATLLEIMLSMAVVMVGLFVLFKMIQVASRGSQSSQRLTQGLSRAELVLEAMRTASPNVLNCLIINKADSWSQCESLCLQWLRSDPKQKGTPSTQACVFTSLDKLGSNVLGESVDSTQQKYAVVYDTANALARSSWVQNNSLNTTVYDAQVTIGWKSDGSAATKCDGEEVHCVTLRTSIYRDPRQ